MYRYTVLGPQQFRLVKLFATKLSTVKCTIVIADLTAPPPYTPPYTAVSYAWGDADDKQHIQIDDVKILISVSLCGALTALCETDRDVYVWADALCIDQQNNMEKSSQIKLMTEIYRRASSVAIWLGPKADDSEQALDFLRDLRLTCRSGSERDIKSLLTSSKHLRDLAAVAALFQRSYWTRIWVVQEVFNAKTINVYCGPTKLPWHVYRTASDTFSRYKGELDRRFLPPQSGLRDLPKLRDSRTYPQALAYEGPSSLPDLQVLKGSGDKALLTVLRMCRRKLSQEPRDKVFALLGILPEDIQRDFPVNYKDSVKEIFTNVVEFLIRNTESLDVICESIHFPKYVNSSNLPSWVPDWSHIPEMVSMGQRYGFQAARNTAAHCEFYPDSTLRNELEISAIYVDTVKTQGIPVGTLCTSSDYLMAFLHWRALLIQSFGRADEGRKARQDHEAFCETLCLKQIPKEWKGGLSEWMRACYYVFASLIRSRLPHLPLDSELETYVNIKTNVDRDGCRQFLQHIGNHMMGRSFCITKGRRMGLGSGFMLPDDIIVVPLGCRTPILLRQEATSPSKYRLVGDVYIEGYMFGRALDRLIDRERTIEKFRLV